MALSLRKKKAYVDPLDAAKNQGEAALGIFSTVVNELHDANAKLDGVKDSSAGLAEYYESEAAAQRARVEAAAQVQQQHANVIDKVNKLLS